MSRISYYARRPTKHLKDKESYAVVKDFLEKIKERYAQLEWFGSRTSDSMKLQSLYKGFYIDFIHLLPEEHPQYIKGNGINAGKRYEEIVLTVKDISRRWGRSIVIHECFDETSTLFTEATKIFDLLWGSATILQSSHTTDVLGYAHAIRKMTKLLEETKP